MSTTSETETSPLDEALKILRMTVAEEQSKAIWAEVVKMLDGELSIAAIAPGVLPALQRFENAARFRLITELKMRFDKMNPTRDFISRGAINRELDQFK